MLKRAAAEPGISLALSYSTPASKRRYTRYRIAAALRPRQLLLNNRPHYKAIDGLASSPTANTFYSPRTMAWASDRWIQQTSTYFCRRSPMPSIPADIFFMLRTGIWWPNRLIRIIRPCVACRFQWRARWNSRSENRWETFPFRRLADWFIGRTIHRRNKKEQPARGGGRGGGQAGWTRPP